MAANTRIKLKRSTSTGVAPTTGDIGIGELGVNLTDKILYMSDGSNIFEIGANLANQLIRSTLTVGNSTVNIFSNSSFLQIANSSTTANLSLAAGLKIGNSTVNSTMISVGANVLINTISAAFGNSTVNTFIDVNSLIVSTVGTSFTANSNKISIGNTTINAVVNSSMLIMSNGTVNSSVSHVGIALYNGTVLIGGDDNGSMEFGGAGKTPYIDFHTQASNDYDVRLIFTGGSSGTNGNGVAQFLAQQVLISGNMDIAGELGVANSKIRLSDPVNGSIQMGGVGSLPYIDWVSTAAADYDVRIQAFDGTGTTGQGSLAIYALSTVFNNSDIHMNGGGTLYRDGVSMVPFGQHTIWMPATAMTPRNTNGPTTDTFQTATNGVMMKTLSFNASTNDHAQFWIQMPKSWNEGTLVYQVTWSQANTTTNYGVAWALSAVAFADDDPADTAFGSEVIVTDTGGTNNDIYISAESAAVTVAGSPAAEELVYFQIKRLPANASDTMTVPARLHGVKIHYTTNAATDD